MRQTFDKYDTDGEGFLDMKDSLKLQGLGFREPAVVMVMKPQSLNPKP